MRAVANETPGKSIYDVESLSEVFRLIWGQTYPLFQKPLLGHTVMVSYIMFSLFSIGQGEVLWFPQFLTQLQENIGSGLTLCEIVGVRPVNGTLDE